MMARSQKDLVAKLNADLKRDVAAMVVKQHITFHMPNQRHEKTVKEQHRNPL